MTLFLEGHITSRDKLKIVHLFFHRTYNQKTFKDRCFDGLQAINSYRLSIARSRVKWKIQVKNLIFILQNLRTTKRDWEETYVETRCNQIMLSTPQRFSVLCSCCVLLYHWSIKKLLRTVKCFYYYGICLVTYKKTRV